jgi:hypothetical protein
VNHFTSPSFWNNYESLPYYVQKKADLNFELLKKNQKHPSLNLKKIGKIWSVRVGINYRALAAEIDNDLLWFWIGSHADYDKLLKS